MKNQGNSALQVLLTKIVFAENFSSLNISGVNLIRIKEPGNVFFSNFTQFIDTILQQIVISMYTYFIWNPKKQHTRIKYDNREFGVFWEHDVL